MPESIQYPFRYVLRQTANGNGIDELVSDVVDSGVTWRVDHLACIDRDSDCTEIEVYITGDGKEYLITQQQSPVLDTLYWYNDSFYIEEGLWLVARFTGATLDDVLEFHYMGVELKPRRR